MDRGACQATFHGVAESQTWLNTNKNTQSLSEADEPNLKFGSRSRLMEAICAHTQKLEEVCYLHN